MTILQLIHKPQNRGAETFTCQLSNHLIRIGHEIKIVAVYDGKANLPFSEKIYNLKATSKYRFFDILAWKKLTNIIKEYNPDIIQANAGDCLKYAVFSKKMFGWKTPIISRNASVVGRYLNSSIQKKLNSFFYKNVAYIISVSKASEKDLLFHYPFLMGRTRVIPIGLESLIEKPEVILEPKKAKHIIHVGGFSFEKNHYGLIRIFQRILIRNNNVHLHLFGDGPLRQEIEEYVDNNDLKCNVSFYGFVNNPLPYIKAADILVLPSLIEGLPGVLLEAMISKTPVVAYNVGGISEILASHTGHLIDTNDEDSFGKATLESLEQPNLLQIDTAYHMVVENYMNEEIALKFEKVYKLVLENIFE